MQILDDVAFLYAAKIVILVQKPASAKRILRQIVSANHEPMRNDVIRNSSQPGVSF